MNQETAFTPNSSLLECLSTIGSKKLSGILVHQAHEVHRKIICSRGQCISVISTMTDELPGSFLFQIGVISKQALEAYLQKALQPDVKQWDAAVESIQTNSEKLGVWKSRHAIAVIQNMSQAKGVSIEFEPKEFPTTVSILCSDVEMILALAETMHMDDIYAESPHLMNIDASMNISDLFPIDIEDRTIIGLKTLIENQSTLEKVLQNSLLNQEKITRYLFAFSQLGWINIESGEAFLQKSFVDNLSEEQKMFRKEIQGHYQRIQDKDYYVALSVEHSVLQEKIEQQYLKIKSVLQRKSSQNLYHETEENFAQKLKLRIEEAFHILSDVNKRKEYDSFLQQGKAEEFFHSSKSIAHEKAMNEFKKLQSQKNIKKTAEFGFEYLSKNQDSIAFSILYVEFVITSEAVKEPNYQKLCFNLLKYHIQHNEGRYEPFFLLGKLCLLLQQHENASKSFARALETRPDLSPLRNYIIEKSKDNGPEIVLEAIAEKLDTMTYYQLLAVDPKASRKDLHNAYRICCRYFHPDRFYQQRGKELHNQATLVFKMMALAYRTLRNVQKREEYDASISNRENVKDAFVKKQPPSHYKAKEYFSLAQGQIKNNNFEGALVNLQFALQFEPDNALLKEKIAWVKEAKKAH